jgi:nucleoside-diphosphate kinase
LWYIPLFPGLSVRASTEDPLTQETLLIVKPDATGRNLAGKIIARLEEEGFRLLGLRLIRLQTAQAESFYQVHRERPFYRDLVTYMCSGPVVVAALQREDAVAHLRKVVGATDPARADAGTLRAMFGRDVQNNAVHASDSPENAAKEVSFFFGEGRA